MHKKYDYDLIVIGAGSGGVRAARMAANKGKSVALIEQRDIGGTCVNRGCVPKKLMLYASSYGSYFEQAEAFGWDLEGDCKSKFSWQRFVEAKDKELARLRSLYKENLDKSGVQIINSTASFVDEHRIAIGDGQVITGEYIIVATGAKAAIPSNMIGADFCLISDDIFNVKNSIDSIVIYGGGYIAVEFANILHGLGVETTLVCRGERLLKNFDLSVSTRLTEAMQTKGIKIYTKTTIVKVEKDPTERRVITFADGKQILAQEVMIATGRLPNTESLKLRNAGVEIGSKGEILVDEYLSSNKKHIFAVGDVKYQLQLAPVAITEAMRVIENIYGETKAKIRHDLVATAVFSQPEIGTIGLTETEALEKYKNLNIFEIDFRPMKTAFSAIGYRCYMKIIVEQESDRVIGVHLLGDGSAELIQIIAVALEAGAKKADFDKTMAVHPTASEELVLSYNPSYIYRDGKRIQ